MKIISLSLFLLVITSSTFAQVIDDTELKNLQSGDYELQSGHIQATFTDDIHPDSVIIQLQRNGYKIVRTDFKPITLSIESEISEEQLTALQENKWVDLILNDTLRNPQSLSNQQEIDASALQDIQENAQLIPPQLTVIQLKMEATKDAVEELRSEFSDLQFKMLWSGSRNAIIETEPGKEMDVMDELKKLDVIESTAMIGLLKEQH